MSEHTQWIITNLAGPIALGVMVISIWYCGRWMFLDLRDRVDEHDAKELRIRADNAEARVREKQQRKAAPAPTPVAKPKPVAKKAAPVKKSADEVAERFVEARVRPVGKPATAPVKKSVPAAPATPVAARRAAVAKTWTIWDSEL